MRNKITLILFFVLFVILGNPLLAQMGISISKTNTSANANANVNANEIEIKQIEFQNDTLFITFDINTPLAIESAWIEIRTVDGKQIVNNSLDRVVWNKVASGKNRKIIWAYGKDGVNIADMDLSIKINANIAAPMNVLMPQQQVITNQAQVYNQKPIKPEKIKQTAKYPLLRPGIELGGPGMKIQDGGLSLKATFTMEYIAKPWWSIHSGVGYQYFEVRHYYGANIGYDNSIHYYQTTDEYHSIIIPLTTELKLNAGRWFRLYAGGGVMARIAFRESDRLNFGQGLNRYMIGLKADAGLEIRCVRLGISYYTDLNSYSIFNDKLSTFNFTFGWRFGGSRAYIRK